MAVHLAVGDIEYAMVAAVGDPDIKQYVGYRTGMSDTSPGVYVGGSNNGWALLGARGGVQIYVRETPR